MGTETGVFFAQDEHVSLSHGGYTHKPLLLHLESYSSHRNGTNTMGERGGGFRVGFA